MKKIECFIFLGVEDAFTVHSYANIFLDAKKSYI